MLCRSLNYPFVQRWRKPTPQLLAGEKSIGGIPPFDPFLTASMLWETHLCPVAAIHELLHGQSVHPRANSRSSHFSRTFSGEEWHSYISDLRFRIASRRLHIPDEVGHALVVIQHDFEEWAQEHLSCADKSEAWRSMIEPYIRTRLHKGQLISIVGHIILPEVTVGSSEVRVPLDGGERSYPIEARVDELNLTLGVAIERTSLPTERALPSKMVQLAAIAAILRSLPAAGIPPQWSALRQVRLFLLETPTDTIPVNPFSRELNEAIHDAAAIIRDVAASELAEWPVYQQAQCTYYNPHPICSHPWFYCFYHTHSFPRFRIPIRRESRVLCRAELRELLWQRDLLKYRLYSPGVAGEAYPGFDIDILRTDQDSTGPFVEARLRDGGLTGIEHRDYVTIIIGTPFAGIRREGRIEEDTATRTLRVYCDVRGLPLPNSGVLCPPINEGLLLERAPDFLIQQRQRNLFALRKMGRSDLQVAQRNSIIQLLDAIFGGIPPLET